MLELPQLCGTFSKPNISKLANKSPMSIFMCTCLIQLFGLRLQKVTSWPNKFETVSLRECNRFDFASKSLTLCKMLMCPLNLQDGTYYVRFSEYGPKKFSSKEDSSGY